MYRLIQIEGTQYSETPEKDIAAVVCDPAGSCVSWLDTDYSNAGAALTLLKDGRLLSWLQEELSDTGDSPLGELSGETVFIRLNMMSLEPLTSKILREKLFIILKGNLLISLQDSKNGDVFARLRKKLADPHSGYSVTRADLLMARMLEAIADNYHIVLEEFRDRIEDLEDLAMRRPHYNINENIMRLKKELSDLRKHIIPLRDVINEVLIDGEGILGKPARNLLGGIRSRFYELALGFETDREMLRDLMEMHKANINQSMNQVMKTLTVITAVFIPLTFVAGVYGMNFVTMPEIPWKYGYVYALVLMAMIALGMILYMKRRKWM